MPMNAYRYKQPSRRRNSGIALLSAILVLFLITALGVVALITAESEVKIIGNMDQAKKMFFLAEQTVDRILMHLYYKPEGVYKLLSIDPIATAATEGYNASSDGTQLILPPYKVLDTSSDNQVHPLIVDPEAAMSMWVQPKGGFWVKEAVIDPQNWTEIPECSSGPGQVNCDYARLTSNPFRIAIRVKQGSGYESDVAGSEKVFVAEIEAKGPLDFSYFAQDLAYEIRTGTNALPVCKDPATYPQYNCNVTLHHRGRAWVRCNPGETCDYNNNTAGDHSNRIIGDAFNGDIYIGSGNNRLFFRGRPKIQGQVWWRNKNTYKKSGGETNQTYGGEGISDESFHPRMAGGLKAYARNIKFFADKYDDSLWGGALSDPNKYHYFLAQAADINIWGGTMPSGYGAVRMLFRHDLDTNNDGNREEPQLYEDVAKTKYRLHKYIMDATGTPLPVPAGAVASAITPTLNNGIVDEPSEKGHVALWFIQWVPSWYYDGSAESERAALSGGSTYERLEKMKQSMPAYQPINLDHNNRGVYFSYQHGSYFNPTKGMLGDPNAANVEYWRVPSRGSTINGRVCSGIIYSPYNVIMSGILDGIVSVFVAGDVILDHEIEYEKDALKYPTDIGDARDMDMMAIFAKGDVVIPNSYPDLSQSKETNFFLDDWSDGFQSGTIDGPKKWDDVSNLPIWEPFNSESIFAPQGKFDDPPLFDDDGSEDIHAVIVSWGYQCHTYDDPGGGGGPPITDCDPENSNIKDVYEKEVANFRVGFYARARTNIPNPGPNAIPEIDGTPFYADYKQKKWFVPAGNQSGPLRVVGSIIQRVPGRVSYDYHNHGKTEGVPPAPYYVNSKCTRGFSEYVYDPGNGQPGQGLWDFSTSKPCNVIGHESFEVTYDPRLHLMSPPSPYDNKTTFSTLNEFLLWKAYGQAAYEVVNWSELPANTNLAVDLF